MMTSDGPTRAHALTHILTGRTHAHVLAHAPPASPSTHNARCAVRDAQPCRWRHHLVGPPADAQRDQADMAVGTRALLCMRRVTRTPTWTWLPGSADQSVCQRTRAIGSCCARACARARTRACACGKHRSCANGVCMRIFVRTYTSRWASGHQAALSSARGGRPCRSFPCTPFPLRLDAALRGRRLDPAALTSCRGAFARFALVREISER